MFLGEDMKAGLYIHIPFCKNKCPYCDFYSVKYDAAASEEYVEQLIKHMQEYDGSFDTIYFGGGTPSAIAPELIGKILDSARSRFSIDNDAEITIECNPSADLQEKMKVYASYGINRVSIGMQSCVDKERFALGRSAGRVQVQKAIEDARLSGIDNISLDLMLGIPKQSLESLDDNFDFIDDMGVEHISAYMLKIENGTKFCQIRDRLDLPDEDVVASMYLKTVEKLSAMGLKQYEISNFAKSGYESRHNIKYWQLDDYLGVGKSAHSFIGGERFYFDSQWKKVSDGKGGDDNEKIMLGLRLSKGVPEKLIKKDCEKYIAMGLMQRIGKNIGLTPQGMLVSNTIISTLLE